MPDDSAEESSAVTRGGPDDFSSILDMYNRWFPEAITQGLPPSDPQTRREWLTGLLDHGENFLVYNEGEVIGHCALLLSKNRDDAEYVIFVGAPHRRKGIGSDLTREALNRAHELGVRQIWLTVEADNLRAIKLYRKFGFVFAGGPIDEWERKMELEI